MFTTQFFVRPKERAFKKGDPVTVTKIDQTLTGLFHCMDGDNVALVNTGGKLTRAYLYQIH